MPFRIKAAEYAAKSNIAYQKGLQASRQLRQKEKLLEPLEVFITTYAAKNLTITYFILLVLDTVFSSSLIKPISENIFNSTESAVYIAAAGVYGGLIYGLTYAAAILLFQQNPEIVDLHVQLESLKKVGEPKEEIRRDWIRKAKYNLIWGILFAFGLLVLILALGFFRIYLISGHKHVGFQSFFDILPVAIALLFAALLVYYGKYKKAFFQYQRVKAQANKWEKQIDIQKELLLEQGRICLDLSQKAETAGELPLKDQDTETCIKRMQAFNAGSESLFSEEQKRTFTIHLYRKSIAQANIQIEVCTAEGKHLYGVTNRAGICIFHWNSSKNYLSWINIHGKRINGDYFESDQHFSFELSQLNIRPSLKKEIKPIPLHVFKNKQEKRYTV